MPMSMTEDGAAASAAGDLTLDAALAARLIGISVGQFMVELRRGNVHGLVERGVGADEGRQRIRLRWRGREAVAVMEGGRLVETSLEATAPPPPAEILRERLRRALAEQKRRGVPLTYRELAEKVRYHRPSADAVIEEALGELAGEDAAAHRPVLAALAIDSRHTERPRRSFFEALHRAGAVADMPDDLDSYAVHARELHKLLSASRRAGRDR